MFKALHLQTGEEILLLEPKWLHKIKELRLMDHADLLVCQGCMQPVRVRVPRLRRAHFAHKHLANCAFGQVSLELLQARALLYEWLVTQFGTGEQGAMVTLEKKTGAALEGGAPTDLPRPVDGWVETGAGIEAYWLIDLRMSPEDRQRLQAWAAGSGARLHWVFLGGMLHENEDMPGAIYLTTTERAFIQPSEYDAAVETAGQALYGSLHYLDPETTLLTSFRGLRLAHSPQVFVGRKEQSELRRVVASPRSGEFVHPGEAARLQRFRQAQSERERKEADRLQRLHEIQSRLAGTPLARPDRSTPAPQAAGVPEETRQLFARQATCIICGEKTTDWVTYYGGAGTCICRKCKK